MELVVETKNAEETKKVAFILAKEIIRGNLKLAKNTALVLALQGELGAGKTIFTQAFALAFKIKEKILSPTFVIMKKIKISPTASKSYSNLYHFDCYRIKKDKEISELGFEEIMGNKKNIILIEWAEKIKKLLPQNHLLIKFEHLGEDKRKIIISNVK